MFSFFHWEGNERLDLGNKWVQWWIMYCSFFMTSRWLRLQRKKQQVWHCGEKETWFKGLWLINQQRPHASEIIGCSSYNLRVHLKIHGNLSLSAASKQSAQWKRIPHYCVAQTALSTISIRLNCFKLEGSNWKRQSVLFTVSLWLWNISIVVLFSQPMFKPHGWILWDPFLCHMPLQRQQLTKVTLFYIGTHTLLNDITFFFI